MAKKGKREIVKLKSTASHHAYYKKVGKEQKGENKLKIKKFDPTPGIRRHVLYEQTKLPK